MPKILLYGAYGYTGTLIAREAQKQNIPLLLAGRREAPLRALAETTGQAWRVLDLADLAAHHPHPIFEGINVVIHAAGPYVETATPMVNACLKAGVHYLDITGEWPVFEQIAARDKEAKAANVMLLPGTGFDVVPSDCLAAFLQDQLPDATHLELAIKPDGGLSHGTAVTSLVHARAGGRSRINGKLVKEGAAAHVKDIPFSVGKRTSASIPWGDIVTAWHSTGIPNIRVYAAQHPKTIKRMKQMSAFSWLLGLKPVLNFLRSRIDKSVTGPTEKTLQSKQAEVWGRAWNAEGKEIHARVTGPQAYALTAQTSLYIAHQASQGNWKAGFQTPSTGYGMDLILEACNAKREIIPNQS